MDKNQKKQIKTAYDTFLFNISSILFKHDPIHCAGEGRANEYEPEAGTIIPRLKYCKNVKDVQKVIYEEFLHWFGDDAARPLGDYAKVAADVWSAWQKYKSDQAES